MHFHIFCNRIFSIRNNHTPNQKDALIGFTFYRNYVLKSSPSMKLTSWILLLNSRLLTPLPNNTSELT